jgi:hypothetical protein
MANNLHRSTSDPMLSNSSNNEPSAIVIRPNVNSPLSSSNQQPSSQSNRLQNSTSTNSLFGQPHQLGTSNDHSSSNQTPIPMPQSPDSRIKQCSFSTDDSAPDITQLALSFQRYSLNVNAVDNILRTMTRPRKHTNSTSSTTSSLSETWSLTRINSYEQNQTQKMVWKNRCSFFLLIELRLFIFQVQHVPSNKLIKLVRKRIDVDGLTKIPDQVTSRMLQKERAYQQQIDDLHEHMRRMRRFVYTLIHNNQVY